MKNKFYIHPTASVDEKATIGDGVKIWHQAQIRENACIGQNTIVGKNVYIDFAVKIAQNCKIQNNTSVYHPAKIESGVFVGPHVCLTNDKRPRAINPDGKLKEAADWEAEPVVVRRGASIGAHTTLLPGVEVGEWAMIGAGSVVTKNVPAFSLVYGNPGKIVGKVDKSGKKMHEKT